MDTDEIKHGNLADKVNKELEKISVISAIDINRIHVSPDTIKKILDEGKIGELKPCLFFPEQEKMIIFDP